MTMLSKLLLNKIAFLIQSAAFFNALFHPIYLKQKKLFAIWHIFYEALFAAVILPLIC